MATVEQDQDYESEEVEVGDDEEKPPPLEYDEDDPNLVEAFAETDEGKEYLKELSKRIDTRFESAWEASRQYRERFAKDWELLECALDRRKGDGFELKPHMPIMLKNVTRLAFRAESELFGNWERPISYAPVGETEHDQQQAEARTKHTNWQFREQILDFDRQMARALMAFFSAGEVVAHSFHDERGNRHEVLTPDDFVMPFTYVTTMPDLSDAPWYAKVVRLYEHQLRAKKDSWFGVDEVIDKVQPSWEDDPGQELRDSVAKREGHVQDDTPAGDAPYKFLEYEGWESEMPGQDRPRWIRAIFDTRTKGLLLLAIHEEPPLQELDRFEREQNELLEYRAAFDHHDAMLQAARADMDIAKAAGAPAPPEADQVLKMPPPARPMWAEPPGVGEDERAWVDKLEPAPPKKKPIWMFSRVVNIENLAGNHGIGHGRLQAHYNRIGNTALREYMDAAASGNIPSYLHDKRITIGDGKKSLAFNPGSLTGVDVPPGMKLSEAVMPWPSPAANHQLVELARLMDEFGQEAAQSPDVLSGEPGKSGETFRGLASRVEQAVKQLSVPTGRFAKLVVQIAKNNARLNAVFLDDEEVRYILDRQSGKYDQIKVGRALYETGSYDATVTSDLRFISKRERVAEADEVLGMLKALPPEIAQQPGIMPFVWAATKKCLEARGMYDMVPYIGEPPPRPQTPFGLPPPAPPGMLPPGAEQQPTPPGELPAGAGPQPAQGG